MQKPELPRLIAKGQLKIREWFNDAIAKLVVGLSVSVTTRGLSTFRYQIQTSDKTDSDTFR